ncbi:uncharacterized protein SCHCODRAFT_02570346 [Schizophyllum commune H4-8]|uniref:uncharacterized protein n=1 Tax=Schizophyllum commune (strain H4-8 / FGSC 9210) TaxID=578458 RepID=UPI00215FD133|nr:uncharacterized protein SCHCODRAFT_02570346 [Schizophyllum commune H4-8]KAI5897000.1 hypothetical protein SCHCODRAFT_02570346 [Schizophyllum commune H4-8]
MFRPSSIRRLIRENLSRVSATAIQRGHEGSSSVNDPPPAPLLLPVDLPTASPPCDRSSHVYSSCAVPPSRADPSTDLSPLARSTAHPRPQETSIGPSRDSRSQEPPNAPHTEDRRHPYTRRLWASDMPAHAMGTAGRSAPSSTLNIYSDDMLPQSSPAGSAPLPDTQWAGYDKEVINVMMPVDLHGCFLILLSAPHLRKIQFWRINGNRNSGKWPELEVRELESLIIRDTEMQIKKLLDCLRIRDLQELEVYYASQCGHNFISDRASYRKLFDSRRHLPLEGRIRIVPNDPKYSGRSSSLERRLKESLRGKEWDIRVTDNLF